jgi:hypothetical protein
MDLCSRVKNNISLVPLEKVTVENRLRINGVNDWESKDSVKFQIKYCKSVKFIKC